MKVSKKTFGISVIAIFWGIILVSMVLGGWQAKQSADQVVVKTVEDLKGWMTISEVSKDFNIPLPEMAQILGIKGNLAGEKKLKDLAEENGSTSDDYKDKLQKYLDSKSGNNAAKTEEKASPTTTESSEEIKGSMTFQEVADKYNIKVQEIYKKLNISTSQDAKVPMKDVTTKYNFEVQDVRDFVSTYKK